VNLIQLARLLPEARLVGVEISGEMRRYALPRVSRRIAPGNVAIIAGDAATVELGELKPDAILFSYALSMIPDWQSALRNGLGQLAPGGALTIVDFGRFEAWPAMVKRRIFRNLAHFHVTPREGLRAFLASDPAFASASVSVSSVFGGCAEIVTVRWR
jgi:S-adenosylmethionine-diacylgycerolhomoserine-N-methlytransferase